MSNKSFDEQTKVYYLTIFLIAILVLSGVYGGFKLIGKALKFGGLQTNAITLVGTQTIYHNLTNDYEGAGAASSTVDILGLEKGVLYLDVLGSSTVSGILVNIQYSPDSSLFYGDNTLESISTSTATTSLLRVDTGRDYLFQLSGDGSTVASTTIPLDFSNVIASQIKINFKNSSSGDSAMIWARFRGKE